MKTFFEHQSLARRNSRAMVVLFWLAPSPNQSQARELTPAVSDGQASGPRPSGPA